MLYQAAITIPASTASTSPTTEMLRIAHGIITKIMVRPRPGHSATAHLVIRYHEHQIAPSTEGMDLHGDTFPIDWEEYHECFQPSYELKLEGWNDSTLYPHTFDVFVVVLPRSQFVTTAIVDAIKTLFSLNTIRRIFTGGS